MIKNPLPFLRQLALLDMEPAVETDWETPEQVRERLKAAHLAFLQTEPKPEWMEEYEELIEAGWGHRVAVYIAWAACPKKQRSPKTIGQVASLLGLHSPRVIYQWRKENPVIDETVTLMQAAPLFQHRADVVQALVDAASNGDYKYAPDRRTYFNLTGDLVEGIELRIKPKVDDLSGLTDEELAQLAGTLETHNVERAAEYSRRTQNGGEDE